MTEINPKISPVKLPDHLEFDHPESIHVFTHRSIEFLTKLGGSTSWVLDPVRAQNCEYIVSCLRVLNISH